jgi:hypothetical protein
MSSASFRTSKHSGCHIVAFEEDFAIFDATIVPLCNINATLASIHEGHNTSVDDDDGAH